MPIELLWALGALSLVMTVAWLRQRATDNAGIVDVIWAASIGVLGVLFCWLGEGWGPRRLVVGAMVGFWSVRLTSHLWTRVIGEEEDGRYRYLREVWSKNLQLKLLAFFQAQAVLAVLLAWPFLVLASVQRAEWTWLDGVAVLVWAGALLGETIADRQLAAWRNDDANQGRTCREGLWAYSRHPNYFFEWLLWTSYPLMAVGRTDAALTGWLLWLAPLALLFLILKVTGIPPTEAQAVRKRGDDYRRYQETVNAFFPGPRDEPETAKTT